MRDGKGRLGTDNNKKTRKPASILFISLLMRTKEYCGGVECARDWKSVGMLSRVSFVAG